MSKQPWISLWPPLSPLPNPQPSFPSSGPKSTYGLSSPSTLETPTSLQEYKYKMILLPFYKTAGFILSVHAWGKL